MVTQVEEEEAAEKEVRIVDDGEDDCRDCAVAGGSPAVAIHFVFHDDADVHSFL